MILLDGDDLQRVLSIAKKNQSRCYRNWCVHMSNLPKENIKIEVMYHILSKIHFGVYKNMLNDCLTRMVFNQSINQPTVSQYA